jgi:aminoglycoside phosphotransferase (APT) family kinase protein
MTMHEDELVIDDDVVRRLVTTQFPHWRGRPVERLVGTGTVNAIYRVGDDLAARFPLQGSDPVAVATALGHEADAMRELAGACPVPTPLPVAIGDPGPGYPMPWSVQTWVPGEVATPDGLAADAGFAADLAGLVIALRGADTRGRSFDGHGRGGHLPDSDAWVAECLRRSADLLPVDRLAALWDGFRALPPGRPDVMSHRDLIPANLLVHDGRLVGVLDGGGFGPADPALDLVAAWHLLDADARTVFRDALSDAAGNDAVAGDDLEWRRGAAWAFEQAIGLVWYYRESNPGMAALGRSTLGRLLDAFSSAPSAGR